MLCQIEAAYAYAEKSDRVVVVDTNYRNARAFKDKLSTYFSSRSDRLILDSDAIEDRIDAMTVFPEYLFGRLSTYKLDWGTVVSNWCDSETGSRLSFDFDEIYTEQILLHHACGGGQASLKALSRLQLRDAVIDLLEQRIDAIGQSFSAIHIRNTDYKTDYRSQLEGLKGRVHLPVFVATDDSACREYCIELFGKESVRYFSSLPEESGVPLHAEYLHTSVFIRNSEAILDLLMLALATDFFKISLSPNAHHATYSGFSLLAENLKNAPDILAALIGSSAKGRSILERIAAWRRESVRRHA